MVWLELEAMRSWHCSNRISGFDSAFAIGVPSKVGAVASRPRISPRTGLASSERYEERVLAFYRDQLERS
jgi:hypothetical protein